MTAAMTAGAEPRARLLRRAIRLEQFSVAWMLIEAGVAVTAGVIAGSLALTSFGFDSIIELVSSRAMTTASAGQTVTGPARAR
jgi:divalent metal cation (Fe/Co/Zn/Cd) transporter